MTLQEITKRLREIAANTKFPVIKEKILSLAKSLESLPVEWEYFPPAVKGTISKLNADLKDLRGKLETCSEAEAAQGFCIPFYAKLEKLIEEIKTLK
jgi:hypothetical protein